MWLVVVLERQSSSLAAPAVRRSGLLTAHGPAHTWRLQLGLSWRSEKRARRVTWPSLLTLTWEESELLLRPGRLRAALCDRRREEGSAQHSDYGSAKDASVPSHHPPASYLLHQASLQLFWMAY